MENEEYTSDELEEFCQELTTMKFLQKSFLSFNRSNLFDRSI